MFCWRRTVTRRRHWKRPWKKYLAVCALVVCVFNGFVFFSDIIYPVSKAAADQQDLGLRPLPLGRQRPAAQQPVTTTAQPVNHSRPFDVLVRPSTACADDTMLLVYVHTAPANFKRRMVIRQTWGDVTQYGVAVRVVFVMGVVDDAIDDVIRFEADAYGDVIQESFVDSYRNLTYKALAALRWVTSSCDRSRFVLKTDDDIFVNLFVVLFRLRAQSAVCFDPAPQQQTDPSCRRLLLCNVWDNMPVQREGKWRVEAGEYAAPVYPRYCSGSAFVMTTDSATALYRASFSVPFLWVDDVYLTGLLPAAAGGFTYANIGVHYYFVETGFEEKFSGPQWYSYMFAHVPGNVPGENLNSILRAWKKIVRIARRVKDIPFNK